MERNEAIETRRKLIEQLEERCQEIHEQVFKLNKDQELNKNIISHLQEIPPDLGRHGELFGSRSSIIQQLEEQNKERQERISH